MEEITFMKWRDIDWFIMQLKEIHTNNEPYWSVVGAVLERKTALFTIKQAAMQRPIH